MQKVKIDGVWMTITQGRFALQLMGYSGGWYNTNNTPMNKLEEHIAECRAVVPANIYNRAMLMANTLPMFTEFDWRKHRGAQARISNLRGEVKILKAEIEKLNQPKTEDTNYD